MSDLTAYFVDALPLSISRTFALLGNPEYVPLKEYYVSDSSSGSYVFYERIDWSGPIDLGWIGGYDLEIYG